MLVYDTTCAISTGLRYDNILVGNEISAFELLKFQYLMYYNMFLHMKFQEFSYRIFIEKAMKKQRVRKS